MHFDVIFSGFGGQGALFAGQLLAYAAMDNRLNVTWIPSYGPEMRGGTAHCTVVISDEPIGSPLVRNPTFVVALNNPSVEKYEPLVAPGGCLLFNASLASHAVARTDVQAVAIQANEEAARLGSPKVVNVILLGAQLAHSGVLPVEALERALEAHLPAHRRHLLEINKQALRRGYDLARPSVPLPA